MCFLMNDEWFLARGARARVTLQHKSGHPGPWSHFFLTNHTTATPWCRRASAAIAQLARSPLRATLPSTAATKNNPDYALTSN
jgi:hypothetical protein